MLQTTTSNLRRTRAGSSQFDCRQDDVLLNRITEARRLRDVNPPDPRQVELEAMHASGYPMCDGLRLLCFGTPRANQGDVT